MPGPRPRTSLPAESARLAVANRLHAVAIQLLRHLRRADFDAALSPARLSALSTLVFGEPRTLGELAAAQGVTPATMSRLVRGLEDDGLVERRADPGDGRAVIVAATPEGARILLQARRERVEDLAHRLAELDGPTLDELGRAAEVIERVLHAD